MAKEIERKFRVADLDPILASPSTHLRQAYLHSNPGLSLRVRIGGDHAWLTIKGPITGISRSEYEYEIPVADAEAMIAELSDRPLIDKTRYAVSHAGHTWDVDVFHGPNAGLVIAEIELDAEDESVPMPPWLGREVTSDRRYANSNLAETPWCEWHGPDD